uniref:Putative ovule protein n=1 Tax=Solanum chacoense TaxID=4108 RepID=A0A0V0H6A2_SOLCH
MIGMSIVFNIDVYALLDISDALSFVTQYVANKFDMLPEVLLDPFSISTPVGDSVVAKRVYRICHISLSRRITLVDSVELDILDFDVILVWIGCMHVMPLSIVGLRWLGFNFQMSLS